MSTLLFSAKSAAAPVASRLELPPITESRTSTGLTVLTAERGPLPLVAIRLTLRVGSAQDPDDKHGIADFTARLLRRGTAKRSADEIDEAVEFVGASLSVGVSEDQMSVYVTTPAEHFAPMLAIIGELVREPSFPEKEVEMARERALAQFANDLDDPALIADRAFARALWGNHPYGHEVGGSSKHVRTFKREDVVRFHKENLGPKIALLTVVGAVGPADVAREAERAFGSWKGGPEAPKAVPPVEKIAKTGQVILVDKPDQTQSQVRIGGIGFRTGHPDYFPAVATNIALGGGFISRLVDEIRVNRGLSYSADSYFDSMQAGGIFGVTTFTKTESTRLIIDVALGEVEKVRTQGITARELKSGQTYLCGLYPLRTETNESVAGGISDSRINGLGDDWVEKFRDRLKAVTVKQAAAVAKRYFLADKPVIVVLGKADAVKKQLKGLGPITVVPASDYE